MKKRNNMATALILALAMILTLCACGGNELTGSWYEEGTGRLLFQLFKNGECDLYTSGVRSAGKWSVSGDTLRMVTIINNENYTIDSLKGGCLTVTDSYGRTRVLWNSEEKALYNGTGDNDETAAKNSEEATPHMEDREASRLSDSPTPKAEPTPTPTSTPAPTPEPIEYYTIIDAQDNYLFALDNGNTTVLNTDGQLVFRIPGGRSFIQFQDPPRFIGDYAVIDDYGIIDRQGNIVFELSDSYYDELRMASCMDVGYIVCSRDFNTFDFTGTRFYAVNLKTGEALELPGEVNEDNIFDPYYLGNGFFAIGFWDHDTILNVKNASVYKTYCESKNVNYRLLDPSDVWIDGDIYHEVDSYCDLNTGEVIYTDSPDELLDILDTQTISSWNCTHLQGPLYSSSQNGVKVIFNLSSSEVTPMSDYRSYQVLKLFEDGSMFVKVENDGGGKFLTVIETDGARRFEPIPLGDYTYADSCFEVWDDNGDIIYDYSGRAIASISNAYTELGNRTALCRDKSNGRLSLIDLESGDTMDVGITAGDMMFTGGSYVVEPGDIDGSVILHEDGTVIYLEKGKLEQAPAAESNPALVESDTEETVEVSD